MSDYDDDDAYELRGTVDDIEEVDKRDNDDDPYKDSEAVITKRRSTIKDLFGDDASSDDDDVPNSSNRNNSGDDDRNNKKDKDKNYTNENKSNERNEKQIMVELFGDDSESSDEIEDDVAASNAERSIAPEEPQLSVTSGEISLNIPDLPKPTTEQIFVRLPNFMGIQPLPFNSETWEGDPDDHLANEDGIPYSSLLTQVIRWRFLRDATGQLIKNSDGSYKRESNAKLVKWSDGSCHLLIGSDAFDVVERDEATSNAFIYARTRNLMQCHGSFCKKMTFQPLSVNDRSHRRFMQSRHKEVKESKIRITSAIENSELRQERLEKEEEDRIRASQQLAERQRKSMQKSLNEGLTARYLEEGTEGGQPHGFGIAALKAKRGFGPPQRPQQRVVRSYYDDSDDSFIDNGNDDDDDGQDPSLFDDDEMNERDGWESCRQSSSKRQREVTNAEDDDLDDLVDDGETPSTKKSRRVIDDDDE